MAIAIDNVLEAYDGSLLFNVKPHAKTVYIDNENTDEITWNTTEEYPGHAPHSMVTVRHALGTIPIASIYGMNGELLYPTVRIIDGDTFVIDFAKVIHIESEKFLTCVMVYGTAFDGEFNYNGDNGFEVVEESGSSSSSSEGQQP